MIFVHDKLCFYADESVWRSSEKLKQSPILCFIDWSWLHWLQYITDAAPPTTWAENCSLISFRQALLVSLVSGFTGQGAAAVTGPNLTLGRRRYHATQAWWLLRRMKNLMELLDCTGPWAEIFLFANQMNHKIWDHYVFCHFFDPSILKSCLLVRGALFSIMSTATLFILRFI